MKKIFATLLLMLCVGAVTFAQTEGKKGKTDLTAQVPIDKKVTIGHLDNGFTYYIRNNKKPENRIQFRLVSNAGSILEREDQRGLAHFCEHMAFNGIKGYPGNSMISTLQQHGVEFGRGINAYTSFDETVYYVDMPADDSDMVRMGIEILDGWAGNILFDSIELEEERGVIHEEWRGSLGASDRIRKATWPTMLAGSKYHERLPIGLEEVIMGFTRQSIVDFFNDWYRPDLQAIVIVGDLDNFEYANLKGVKAMEQRVKDVFGQHPKAQNPMPRPTFDVPGNKEPLCVVATDPEQPNTLLQIFWKHPKAPQGTVGDYRQSLVRSLINKMIADRFSEISQQASAPFMYAGADYSDFIGRTTDIFGGAITPKEGRIEESFSLFLAEVKRMRDHGFLEAELERQKEDLLSYYTKQAKEENKTQNDALAGEYSRHFLDGEVIPGIRQEWRYAKEFLPEITLEECNALVKSWVTDENVVIVLTAPEKPDFKVPTEKQLIKLLNKSKKVKTKPWVDNSSDEPLFAQQLPEVTPQVSKQNTALDYTEYTLPNGVRFVVKKTDLKADEILISSYAMGGTSLYNDEEAYQADNAASFIDAAGIASFSATQLEKKLKGMNLSISPSISDYTQGFHGNCSPKDLETTLQLIHLYYTAPRKDKETYDRLVESTLNQIKFIAERPQVAFIDAYKKLAFPNDKRSVVVPTEAQVRGLNLDRMYEIYQERFHDASGQTFFFTGNVSEKDIALIARYLGALPCDGKQKNEQIINREPQFATGVQRASVQKGSDETLMIIQGQTSGFSGDYRERLAVNALSDALGMTTLQEIREKRGLAYSPSARVSFDLHPNKEVSWMFYIGTNPDSLSKVESACLDLLRQYCEEGTDSVTLAKVKEQMIINRGTQKQNNSFWSSQIYGSYFYNEDRDDYILNYDELVRSITNEDIKAAARKYINLNNYIVATLSPATE